MATLWMRLGVFVSLSDKEMDILRKHESLEDYKNAKEVIRNAFNEGRIELNGETYVPMKEEPDWDYYF